MTVPSGEVTSIRRRVSGAETATMRCPRCRSAFSMLVPERVVPALLDAGARRVVADAPILSARPTVPELRADDVAAALEALAALDEAGWEHHFTR